MELHRWLEQHRWLAHRWMAQRRGMDGMRGMHGMRTARGMSSYQLRGARVSMNRLQPEGRTVTCVDLFPLLPGQGTGLAAQYVVTAFPYTTVFATAIASSAGNPIGERDTAAVLVRGGLLS